jgi:hypothetical protein
MPRIQLSFVLSVGLASLASGCFIDGTGFQDTGSGGGGANAPTGGGGEGGTTTGTTDPGGAGGGTTTGTATGTTTTTTTSTGTTTGTDCSVSEDCTAMGFCFEGTCPDGTCSYTPKAAGTFVSNADPTDCKKRVCNGSGQETDADEDMDTPPPDGNECHERICSGGMVAEIPINEDVPCGPGSNDPCKVDLCEAGSCQTKNVMDGTAAPDDDLLDCATVVCEAGEPKYVGFDVLCDDPTPTDCKLPKCTVGASGGTCSTQNANQGAACTKANNMPGTCNPAGICG